MTFSLSAGWAILTMPDHLIPENGQLTPRFSTQRAVQRLASVSNFGGDLDLRPPRNVSIGHGVPSAGLNLQLPSVRRHGMLHPTTNNCSRQGTVLTAKRLPPAANALQRFTLIARLVCTAPQFAVTGLIRLALSGFDPYRNDTGRHCNFTPIMLTFIDRG